MLVTGKSKVFLNMDGRKYPFHCPSVNWEACRIVCNIPAVLSVLYLKNSKVIEFYFANGKVESVFD